MIKEKHVGKHILKLHMSDKIFVQHCKQKQRVRELIIEQHNIRYICM